MEAKHFVTTLLQREILLQHLRGRLGPVAGNGIARPPGQRPPATPLRRRCGQTWRPVRPSRLRAAPVPGKPENEEVAMQIDNLTLAGILTLVVIMATVLRLSLRARTTHCL